MAHCSIRIELHGAGWGGYLGMCKRLVAQGIKDIVASDDDAKYKPLPAGCNYEGWRDP